ncbi:hypothetical protein PENTCL1PPCAC_10874, partial [Pristionchus entomophagus]
LLYLFSAMDDDSTSTTFGCLFDGSVHEYISTASKQEEPVDSKALTSEVGPQPSELLNNCGIDLSREHPRIRKVHDLLTQQLKKCETCPNQLSTYVIPSEEKVELENRTLREDSVVVQSRQTPYRPPKISYHSHYHVYIMCKPCRFVSESGHSIRLSNLDTRSISIINHLLFPHTISIHPPDQKCTHDNGLTVCFCDKHRLALN